MPALWHSGKPWADDRTRRCGRGLSRQLTNAASGPGQVDWNLQGCVPDVPSQVISGCECALFPVSLATKTSAFVFPALAEQKPASHHLFRVPGDLGIRPDYELHA